MAFKVDALYMDGHMSSDQLYCQFPNTGNGNFGSGGVTNVKWQREMFRRHTTCPRTHTDLAVEG